MKDNSLGATQLNEKSINEQDLEKSMQELYDVKKKIEELKLPKGFKPISLSKYKNLNLTGKLKDSNGISEKDVYALELEKEDERLTQLYEFREKELVLLATINEKNELILSNEEKDRYEELTREGELDKPFTIDEQEMEKEKQFEISLEKDKNHNDKKTEDRETQIAKSIGVKPENVLMVVEIKDEVTFSRVLNKNVETMNLYAVKIRQDSGGIGSNDWIIVNQKANGKYEQAMKDDKSDSMQDIAQTTNLKWDNLSNPDLDPNDINTIQKNGTRYVETRINGTYMDNQEGIIEVRKDGKATVHIAREGCNGKAELLCDDEHELHDEEKIELPDRDVEIEQDEKEDRTPGGDAYEKRFEHRH